MPHARVSLQRTPTPRDSLRRRKAADERLEVIADIWEQVRAEVLQERLEQLSQKVLLQRELIAAQDQRAKLIRRQKEEFKLKKRNEQKKKRQDVLADLQAKCKQALEHDRETKSKSHASNTRAQSRKNETDHEHTCEKITSLPRRAHSSSSSSHADRPVCSSTQEIENEGDDVSRDEHAPRRTLEGISATSQNAELFKLYGHNAGKYGDAKKLFHKKIPHATLTKLAGHLSASEIWTTLWSDSVSKLLQADERFPKDLKETFSSHVRQGITKFKKPVSRSFTLTEDVPDLDSLMDKSKLNHVRVLRHKTQLMYRSSRVNQDRTRILLFNNPLPSLGDGEEGVSRFLPPCNDTDSVSTEASYLRWLKDDHCPERRDNHEITPYVGRKMRPSLLSGGSAASKDLQDICDSLVTRRKPKKEPRYHFLTEQEAWSPGAFLARLHLDKGPGRPELVSPQNVSHSRAEPAESMSPAERSKFKSSWEPLSLQALKEYKQQLSAEGHGEFQHGRPAMWRKLPA